MCPARSTRVPTWGCKDLGQAVIGAYPLDHGQTGGDIVPLALIELEGGRPIGVSDDGSNEIGAARPLQEVGGLLRVALGLCPDARIVQDEGHETAHGAKGKARQELVDLAGGQCPDSRGRQARWLSGPDRASPKAHGREAT